MPPQRGVILRHLVMPGQTEEAAEIMKFVAEDVSKDTYVNVMEQYRVVVQSRFLSGNDLFHLYPNFDNSFSKLELNPV